MLCFLFQLRHCLLGDVPLILKVRTYIVIYIGLCLAGNCNLLKGQWVYHPAGPLYTNNTCTFITQMQNCQGNGRPDKEYENWRWKPDDCDLPLFDGRKFLELMRDKTVAFVGDSVARNQFESMLCILSQASSLSFSSRDYIYITEVFCQVSFAILIMLFS